MTRPLAFSIVAGFPTTLLLATVGFLALGGCDRATPVGLAPPAPVPTASPAAPTAVETTTAEPTADENTNAKAPDTSGISLEIASWEETQQLIAKHKGKVVVLDLWSTSCEPCVKEFPHLIELQQKYPDDVVAISLNSNFIGLGKPEDEKPALMEFLTQKQAKIVNILCSDADEDLYKKVGIASIPVVQVYGRDGKLAKQFDDENQAFGKGGFNYEQHIEPFVAELVKEK